MTLIRKHVGKRLSEITVHNQTVYLAGQIAENNAVGMYEQAKEILARVDALLAEVGSDKTQILSTTIFITEMALFSEMNRAWDEWVVAGHTPPRATVEAKLADPKCLVEFKIIAAQIA